MAVIVNGREHRTLQHPMRVGDGRQMPMGWANDQRCWNVSKYHNGVITPRGTLSDMPELDY